MSLTSVTSLDASAEQAKVALPPELAAKLAEPAVTEALTSLLSHADLVAVLVEGLDGLIGRSDEIGATLMEGFADLRATVESNESLAGAKSFDFAAITGSVNDFIAVLPQVKELLTPGTLAQLGMLARGLSAGSEQYPKDPVPIGGLLSLMKLIKDPQINAAISYAATVLRAVGRELESK